MKCIKCQAELREGAKFCTVCGTRQVSLEAKETSCGMPQHAGNKSVEEAVSQAAPQPNASVQQTNNYLFWHVQPGEIARIINETEFVNYASARGIIINQGTVALVYAQGKLITTIHGGKYDFTPSEKVDSALNRHFGGVPGVFRGVKRFLARLIFGQSARERIEKENDAELRQAAQLDQVIEYLNSGNLFSVVLMQDREFELLFGDSRDGQRPYNDFRPMSVQTAHLDLQVGVSAVFKVTDRDMLMRQYLVETNVLTTELLAKTLAPHVENAVQKCIGNAMDESLDAAQLNNALQSCLPRIENELKQVGLYGISLQRVLKITCSNEDIERFRQLSHDLYVSEEELNYLNRTNEFKNRLATAANQQLLQEARTELDLMRSLEEINKDGSISKDELERFYIVLSRERRVFEAEDAEKERAALDEIRKTGLLREEELAILKHEAELRQMERNAQLESARLSGESAVQTQSYRNGFALKLMQLKDSIDYEKVRTGGEAEINLMQLQNELEITSRKDAYKDRRFEVELGQQRQRDDYAWQQRQREQAAQNEQTFFNLNIAQQAQQMQMDRYRAMTEIDSDAENRAAKRRMEEENARREHEQRMHAMDVDATREHNRLRAGMTAEQIAAEQLSQLDKEAQAAYFNAGRNQEQEREFNARQQQLYEDQLRREEMRSRETQQQLSDMFQQAMNTMATMSGNMVENRNEQRREYREELHREQERHDMHQDRALNYTTRVASAPDRQAPKPQNVQKPQPSPQDGAADSGVQVCPQCHKRYPSGSRFCDDCGCELESLNR